MANQKVGLILAFFSNEILFLDRNEIRAAKIRLSLNLR